MKEFFVGIVLLVLAILVIEWWTAQFDTGGNYDDIPLEYYRESSIF